MEMSKCKRRLTDREEEEEEKEEGEQIGEGGRPSDAIGGVLEHQAWWKHSYRRERLQSQETHPGVEADRRLTDREEDQRTDGFSGLKGRGRVGANEEGFGAIRERRKSWSYLEVRGKVRTQHVVPSGGIPAKCPPSSSCLLVAPSEQS